MKKLLASVIILSIVFAAGSVFAKDWKKIRVGVEGAYPPFSFVTPDGKLDGFDIDIA
ncbi:MAG: transporter substrate-binding domain-containing protein, partial [Desulfobacula sp.]|nr:transporter substrate-binding domain-containing protein [Desulfobacula sp.]